VREIIVKGAYLDSDETELDLLFVGAKTELILRDLLLFLMFVGA